MDTANHPCAVSLKGWLHPTSAVYREGFATCLEDTFTLVPVALVFLSMLPSIIKKPRAPALKVDVMNADPLHGLKIFILRALGVLTLIKFAVQNAVGYPRHIVLATGNLLAVALLGLMLMHYNARQMIRPLISPLIVWFICSVTAFIRIFADYKLMKFNRADLRSFEIYKQMDQTMLLFACGITCLFLLEIISPARTPKPIVKPKGNRRASFVTAMLANGSFPAKAKVSQPIIHNVIHVENLPKYGDFAKHLTIFFEKWDRFMCVPVANRDKSTSLEKYGRFDIHEHINKKDVADEKECQEYLESLFFKDFDLTKPAVRIDLVNVAKGRSAIIITVHHLIGDGMSLLASIRDLFTDKAGNSVKVGKPLGRTPDLNKRDGSITRLCSFINGSFTGLQTIIKCAGLPSTARDTPAPVNEQPYRPYRFTQNRTVVYAPPIALEKIKRIKDSLDVTVNDVLTGLLAGAYRQYNAEERKIRLRNKELMEIDNERLPNQSHGSIRALVPVAFPRSEHNFLRNLWSFVSVGLPVDREDPITRVRAASAAFNCIKKTHEAYVQLALQRVASSILGQNSTRKFAYDIMTKHTCVFTNIPGPSETVYLLGRPVLELSAIIPNVVQQVSMISYADTVSCNFVVDPNVVREPKRLGECLIEELNELDARVWVYPGRKMDAEE